ncbi:MAG: ornithine acetyltransferase, partial [Nitrospirae bacterium]
EETFNSITVDNDMSTNDTVLLLSSSMAGNTPLSVSSQGLKKFQKALFEVMDSLARMIVKDGEGATKTMEVIVKGARTKPEARRAARAVAGSLLVKTAIYGADPNWGRIMAALGASGIRVKPDAVAIKINGVKVVNSGVGTGREEEARMKMQKSGHIVIEIKLKEGDAQGRALGCDLTEDYVKLNAHYTT